MIGELSRKYAEARIIKYGLAVFSPIRMAISDELGL